MNSFNFPDPLSTYEGIANFANALNESKLKQQQQAIINKFLPQKSQADIDSSIAQTNEVNTLLPGRKQQLDLQNKYYSPNMLSNMAYQNAQTNRINKLLPADISYKNALAKNAGLGLGGIGTGGREEYMFENFVSQDNPQLKTPQQIYEASNVLRQGGDRLSDGTPLNQMSPATRSSLDRLISGTAPAATRNNLIGANQADAEINAISKYAQAGLKDYGDTYFNMSPNQIVDSFKNDEKSQKKLGRLVAAQQLQYEIAQNEIKLANGQPGINSTEELMNIGKQMIDTKFPKMSYTARSEAQRYLLEALKEGLSARKNVGISISKSMENNSSNNQSNNPSNNNNRINIPNFNSSQEFQRWFNSQSSSNKAIIRDQLRNQ